MPVNAAALSIHTAIGLLGLGLALSVLKQRRAALIALALFLAAAAGYFIARAITKQYPPFTERIEGYVAFSAFLVAVALAYGRRLSGREHLTLLASALAAACSVFVIPDVVRYTPIYLNTYWYPLHIVTAYAASAFWFAAGIKALYDTPAWRAGEAPGAERPLTTELNRAGFVIFTVSMLAGGIWGYLAWGAYFMWDPKLHWSAILWLYYGNLLHIDALPRLRRWKIPLYALGILLILATFVGTGFFPRTLHKI